MGRPPTEETLANFFPDIFESQWFFLRFWCFWQQYCPYRDWGTVLMFCIFTAMISSRKTCQLDSNYFQWDLSKRSNNQPPSCIPARGPRQSPWNIPQRPAPIEQMRLPRAWTHKGKIQEGRTTSKYYEDLTKSTVFFLRFRRLRDSNQAGKLVN